MCHTEGKKRNYLSYELLTLNEEICHQTTGELSIDNFDYETDTITCPLTSDRTSSSSKTGHCRHEDEGGGCWMPDFIQPLLLSKPFGLSECSTMKVVLFLVALTGATCNYLLIMWCTMYVSGLSSSSKAKGKLKHSGHSLTFYMQKHYSLFTVLYRLELNNHNYIFMFTSFWFCLHCSLCCWDAAQSRNSWGHVMWGRS